MSNSRSTTASLPPRDRLSIARSCVPGRVAAPRQIQSSLSFVASASRSSITSHSGCAVRKLSSVVRRHSPRGCVGVLPEIVEMAAAPARRTGCCRAGPGWPPACRGRRRTAAEPCQVARFCASTQASARRPRSPRARGTDRRRGQQSSALHQSAWGQLRQQPLQAYRVLAPHDSSQGLHMGHLHHVFVPNFRLLSSGRPSPAPL